MTVKLLEPTIPLKPAKAGAKANEFFTLDGFRTLLGEFLVEPKYDGIRLQLHRKGDTIKFFTDGGQDVTAKLPMLQKEVTSLKGGDFILDGELVKYVHGTRLTHEAVSRLLFGKLSPVEETGIRFKFFDVLWWEGNSAYEKPLKERRAIIDSVPDGPMIHKTKAVVASGGDAVIKAIKEVGSSEGAVVKALDSPYTPAAASKWYKYKAQLQIDVKVVEITESAGGAYIYTCAIGDGSTIGKTFATSEKFEKGDIITVSVDRVMEKDGRFTWLIPKVLGKREDRKEADPPSVLKEMAKVKTEVQNAIEILLAEANTSGQFVLQAHGWGPSIDEGKSAEECFSEVKAWHHDLRLARPKAWFGFTILPGGRAELNALKVEYLGPGEKPLAIKKNYYGDMEWMGYGKEQPFIIEAGANLLGEEGNPSTQYKAALVVIDSGSYEIAKQEENSIRITFQGSQLKGDYYLTKQPSENQEKGKGEKWWFFRAKEEAPEEQVEEAKQARLYLADLPLQKGAREYEVTLIRPGETLHGWFFPEDVLRESVPLWKGAASFVDHSWLHQSIKSLVGVVSSAAWGGDGIKGKYRLLEGPEAPWLQAMLDQIIRDREAGLIVPRVGLSADLLLQAVEFQDGGVEWPKRKAVKIQKVVSVDVVFDPAAGGAFERVLNSIGGNKMSGETQPPGVTQAPPAPDTVAAGINLEELARTQCSLVLDSALRASELPQPSKDAIRARFQGKIFRSEELETSLTEQQALIAKLLQDNVIKGMGVDREGRKGPIVARMADSLDQITLAIDQLFGIEIPDSEKGNVARLSGIRELYHLLSGDYDFYGKFFPERVYLANVTTTTFTSAVKNVLNKVLLKAYNVRPKWWTELVTEEDMPSLNQATLIRVGGFGDLPTVAEGGAYTELTWSDEEETVDFVKKGGFIGVTLEMIDRDDVKAVKRIPQELGNAAWRTLSALVSALFTANSGVGPTLSDALALFHTTHVNLLTTALSAAQWDVVCQAVFKQTEPNSGKRLALKPKFCLVPIELELTGNQIFAQPWSSVDAKHFETTQLRSAQVIVVPEWTDANDWAALVDPKEKEGIYILYRFGREPELFVADDQVVGSMFTNDEMRIKARFFVGVGVGDYRTLHKSNVA